MRWNKRIGGKYLSRRLGLVFLSVCVFVLVMVGCLDGWMATREGGGTSRDVIEYCKNNLPVVNSFILPPLVVYVNVNK